MPFDSLPVVTDEVTAALQLARSYIERGWCKGFMEDDSSGQVNYCSIGAIRKATGAAEYQGSLDQNTRSVTLFWDAVDRLCNVVDKQSHCDWQNADEAITKWNDQKSRTKAQVLAAFDKAIAKNR